MAETKKVDAGAVTQVNAQHHEAMVEDKVDDKNAYERNDNSSAR